jgi:hypothetical protein
MLVLPKRRHADRSKEAKVSVCHFDNPALGGARRTVWYRRLDLIPLSHTDCRVDGTAMLCQTAVRDHEFLQWRLDVVEVDVGDEAIDAGVDGRRSVAMDITLPRDQVRECGKIGEPASHRGVSLETADALVIIALSVELLGLHQLVIGKARMLALERIEELGPIALILPARIGHHPVEIVERARDEEIGRALRRRQRRVQRHAIFFGDIDQDGLAVADAVMAVDDIGQLSARRLRCVENVFVPERHAGELQKSEYLQSVAIVVGDAEQRRIGIECEHGGPFTFKMAASYFKIDQSETSGRTLRIATKRH